MTYTPALPAPIESRVHALTDQAKTLPIMARFFLLHLLMSTVEQDMRSMLAGFTDIAGFNPIPVPVPSQYSPGDNPLFDPASLGVGRPSPYPSSDPGTLSIPASIPASGDADPLDRRSTTGSSSLR